MLPFQPVPITGKGQAVALFGENCKEGEGDPSNGCTIYVNGARAWFTSSHGIVDRAPHLRLTSTGRGRWLGGITSISDTGSCSVMLRSWNVSVAHLRQPVLRHLARTTATSSASRRTATASARRSSTCWPPPTAPSSGPSPRRATARSATYFEEVWEDAEHVLVVTYPGR